MTTRERIARDRYEALGMLTPWDTLPENQRRAVVDVLIAENDRRLGWDDTDIADAKRMLPHMDDQTYNPIAQVFFRAGLLVARETMARFVEQGGDHATAASIRANWWPSLGPDPGPPRQNTFDEVGVQRDDGWIDHADIPPSIEALSRAWQFMHAR